MNHLSMPVGSIAKGEECHMVARGIGRTDFQVKEVYKMGREKEERLVREEQARLHAPKCEICGNPLLVVGERRVCSSCSEKIN
jgi:hypothetical protein